MIAVCVCTHNPAPTTWEPVIGALARQSAPIGSFHVVIVDNASSPPLGEAHIAPLLEKGIAARILREPRAGLSRARLKAIAETTDDWVIFVDDDNELDADYVSNAAAFAAAHPQIGCFGGRLLLPPAILPEAWVMPFLPNLGIRDYGDAIIASAGVDAWGEWEPVGAGAVVHRRVLDEYVRRSQTAPDFFGLGRSGGWGLASCDDSLMMRGAVRIGFGNAYVPELSLTHHLHPKRFRFSYLMRLMYGYGQSFVRLDRILHGDIEIPKAYRSLWSTLRQMKRRWREFSAFPWQMRLGQALADFGRYTELHRRPGNS